MQRAGGSDFHAAAAGDHAELAATVTGPDGAVFVKGACSQLGVRSLRYELSANNAASRRHAPAVLWTFETGGWLVAGFEHCDGRHADLSPGSADLDLLDAAVDVLAATAAPAGSWFSPQDRLGFDHPAIHGDTLVHTDLNPANLIVTADGLKVVD